MDEASREPCCFCDVRVLRTSNRHEGPLEILTPCFTQLLEIAGEIFSCHPACATRYGDCVARQHSRKEGDMHDTTLWAAWYLLLLAVPFCIIGSLIREKLARISQKARRQSSY